MQHLEKIVFGVVLAAAVILVAGHATSGVNTTKPEVDAKRLAADMQSPKEPKAAAAKVPSAEKALNPFIQTVEQPPRAGRWSFYRRPTLKGIEKKKPDTRKILDAPALTAVRTDFTAKLTWTDAETNTAKTTAYRVYRWVGDAKPDKNPVAELKPEVKEWTDTDAKVLAPEATVHYAVTALTGEETRHGKPETPLSEAVTVTFPYDLELVYYGSSWSKGEGKAAEIYVKKWHAGGWRGPVRFTVETGNAIGAKASTDVDGAHTELDFTTKWTLKDAGKTSEKREVDGVERVIEERWIVFTDKSGAETRLVSVEKPKTGGAKPKPKDPVSQKALDLWDEMQAARAAKDTDEYNRLKQLREWINRGKRKWWNSARKQPRTETLEKDLQNLEWDLEDEQGEDRPKPSKIKELQEKIKILKGFLG
jgi:hypothetical protein